MNVAKGVPLTKQEVLLLLSLVENNPVIFSKGTNAVSNKTKEDAWVRITHLFNASVESGPRKPEQLRLKWENLKKNARKRNNKIMRNNTIKADGGIAEFIPPDVALEKVSAILGESDAMYADEIENCEAARIQEVLILPHPESQESSNQNFENYSLQEKSKLLKQKTRKIRAEELKSRIRRNNAVAEYYSQKTMRIKHEKEMSLTSDKLKSEIEQLKISKARLELDIMSMELKKRNSVI
ncbi:uncharacterized protein LOC126967860 isoform X2 [Leptidea sinapis]|uniref:uncharacterized protein LOC126967860 isoform X2 n=1 Tax=Leptidea sinapis TaxID=189913 RepID=UPI0021C35CF1|nr:uncharacterized protein LOC126967860 isoform X2 [Leptidea sinapis]